MRSVDGGRQLREGTDDTIRVERRDRHVGIAKIDRDHRDRPLWAADLSGLPLDVRIPSLNNFGVAEWFGRRCPGRREWLASQIPRS